MDFTERLLTSHGKSNIVVAVDHLGKLVHFIALVHSYTAKTITETSINTIVKVHGMPRSIVMMSKT